MLGIWYVLETQQLSDAQAAADQERATATGLRAQRAQLQPLADLEAQIAAAEQLRATVYRNEIRFSGVMRDISAIVPDDVWLTSMAAAFNQTGNAPTTGGASPRPRPGQRPPRPRRAAPAPGRRSPRSPSRVPGSSTSTSAGSCGRWPAGPRRADSRCTSNPYFTTSQKADEGGQDTVTFSATVDLSERRLLRALPAGGDGDPVTRRQRAGPRRRRRPAGAGRRDHAADPADPAGHRRRQRRARQRPSAESQSLRDQIKALEALKPKEAELKAKANLAKAEFPATPALPGLVDALQDAASLSGVELGTVAPSTPKASTLNPLLAEITTTVNVSGGYFEIQDFLVRLENLVKGSDPGRIDAPLGADPVGQPGQRLRGRRPATRRRPPPTPPPPPDELTGNHRPDRVPVGAAQRHVEHAGGAGGHGQPGRAGEVTRPMATQPQVTAGGPRQLLLVAALVAVLLLIVGLLVVRPMLGGTDAGADSPAGGHRRGRPDHDHAPADQPVDLGDAVGGGRGLGQGPVPAAGLRRARRPRPPSPA